MAMDYNKVLEGLKKKKNSTDFMQFDDGKTIIRVAPGHPNMEGFFVAIPHHQKRGAKKSEYVKVICRNLNGEASDCEICPTLEELRESEDKADKKLYKEQMPTDRYFFSAFKREEGDGEEKLQTVECGSMLLEEILNILVDPDYEDLLDPLTGRDITVTKSGTSIDTEYHAQPRAKTSPMLKAGAAASKAFVGKSAKDTKLKDLNELKKQFEDDPGKALLVWEKGWKALKDSDKDDDDDDKPSKKAAAKPQTSKKPSKPAPDPEEDEEDTAEEEAEVDVTSFPKLKSRCSICGDPRYKTPSGNVCANGHGGAEPLADGERPSKPSKAYLKEFPEPEEEEEETEAEEEEAEEEEEAPAPKTAKKKVTAAADDDDGLEELEDIIKTHTTAKKGVKK